MHPRCTLRYSATYVVKHHMVYRLHAVDTYERKLVKQIEVASPTIEVARESFEDFAENLQHEIEEDTGIRFGVIEGISSRRFQSPAPEENRQSSDSRSRRPRTTICRRKATSMQQGEYGTLSARRSGMTVWPCPLKVHRANAAREL